MKYPRSPYEQTGGVVYFGRMIDKIRLNAADELHPDLHANLGIGFDERCTKFLGLNYDDVVAKVRDGLDDEALLAWCVSNGTTHPTGDQIEVWSEFMRKRGWNDDIAPRLAQRKAENGMSARDDICTMFDYIDADEGRR